MNGSFLSSVQSYFLVTSVTSVVQYSTVHATVRHLPGDQTITIDYTTTTIQSPELPLLLETSSPIISSSTAGALAHPTYLPTFPPTPPVRHSRPPHHTNHRRIRARRTSTHTHPTHSYHPSIHSSIHPPIFSSSLSF